MAIHHPYNPHCQICRDAMARRRNAPDRRKQREKAAARSGEVVDPSAGRANLSFGERCTGDYLLQRRADLPSEIHEGDGEEFSYGAKAGAVFLDLGTDWKTIAPVQYRSKEETLRAFQVFCGPDDHVRSVYTLSLIHISEPTRPY